MEDTFEEKLAILGEIQRIQADAFASFVIEVAQLAKFKSPL